jgi:hypothetical protein
MKRLLIAFTLACMVYLAHAQTTTTYNVGPYFCRRINQCIIYTGAPSETNSLWEAHVPGYVLVDGVWTFDLVSDWAYFSLYDDSSGVVVTTRSWNCHSNDSYNVAPADPSLVPATNTITATCHDVDGSGAPFQMAYTINYYSQHVRGSGGKGGGGAGTVNFITSATVTITQ